MKHTSMSILVLLIVSGVGAAVAPTYTLIDVQPDPLQTDYNQRLNISFDIAHDASGLNQTSVAFLATVNYTEDTQGYNYYTQLVLPPNSISDLDPTGTCGKVFHGRRRNLTPYLTFEDNDTITEGNVYKWSGFDIDDGEISFNNINSTHTYCNLSGFTPCIFDCFHYIDGIKMVESTKTPLSISRAQSAIFRIADLSQVLGRSDDYIVSVYFDTIVSPTTSEPSADLVIYIANESFNPLTDDFTNSPNACYVSTFTYENWTDYSFYPYGLCKYTYPARISAAQSGMIDLTPTGYICLSSGTVSSKPYLMNMTDSDPACCNVTFAETKTLWTVNEMAHVGTLIDYTPNIFLNFNRANEVIDFKMFVADNNGDWGESAVYNHPIGIAGTSPTTPDIAYFNVSCPSGGHYHDTRMDATYDSGGMYVGVYASHDPDGGVVTHNLTLHKSTGEYVATVNNTFVDGELIEVGFAIAAYYSTTDAYTLRIVATDDEFATVTNWLGRNFTLAADGTVGNVVSDDLVWFWGYPDIPSLYTAISNPSVLSLSGGIYTAHRPIFKSKCNDTFTFDEDVHLESLDSFYTDAYFRFCGNTYFDGANITAWNTNTNTPATEWGETENRAHLKAFGYCDGYMRDCVLSHLGTDVYQQEGLNLDGVKDFSITNTEIKYGSRGVVFENCVNVTLDTCNIHNSYEVGTGIYTTNHSTITGCVYDSNGDSDGAHSGIRMYHAYHNTISDTTISDSALHGLWAQYSSHNVFGGCGVSSSGSGRDYYFSSSSLNNSVRDPASFTARVTSSSSANITTTNHQVFTDTSPHYYPVITSTGANMYVHSVSHTFDVDIRNMYITPSSGTLALESFVFGGVTDFRLNTTDAISSVDIEATNAQWGHDIMHLDVAGELYNATVANDTGYVHYVYTGGFSGVHVAFSIHERILEGWQALGAESADGYGDMMLFVGVGTLIVFAAVVIICVRGIGSRGMSMEATMGIIIALVIGLLLLAVLAALVPSIMTPLENIIMEGI